MESQEILSYVHSAYKNRHSGQKLRVEYSSGAVEIFSVSSLTIKSEKNKLTFSYTTSREKNIQDLGSACKIFLIENNISCERTAIDKTTIQLPKMPAIIS